MYAEKLSNRKRLPILSQCQNCDEFLSTRESVESCPFCMSTDRSNLIVLHMEEDAERSEWLDLVDFSAGD